MVIFLAGSPFGGGEEFEFFRPVFNFADASISVGVITLFIFQNKFFGKENDENVEKEQIEAPVSNPE